MKELRELTKEWEQDKDFLAHIIFEIRDYANENDQNPDDTLIRVAEWIFTLLQIATFNGKGA